MRVLLGTFAILAMALAAGAAPVPLPPDDFDAAQYVDGAGCVFRREEGRWEPVTDRNDQPICGFPPTFADREDDRTAARKDPEDLLAGQLAADARQGEFLADPRARETRAEPLSETVSSPVLTGIDALVRQGGWTLTSQGPLAKRTCDLLGYEAASADDLGLGQDVTLGLCRGMSLDLPATAYVDTPAREVERSDEDSNVRVRAAPSGSTREYPAKPQEPDTSARSAQASAGRGDDEIEMIPPTARYVQIGAYADEQKAQAVMRRVADLGYSLAQKRLQQDKSEIRLVFVGPFANRRALIAALNHLRSTGYPQAFAR
ncbi:SPOR domain-containing protein [Paracoccus seriniphilus]|uniref:Sporulation related domain-containing protein n=2 Tax=Paracoccus seriniphilus TaxID=184748 RepID=A0A239PWW9_9RHOB|nr:SPOR domain-containing protein [Paracoccus seriniphilus]WCR13100.1 SPOR domain-containing protein [Paracoccus seriniphilus]SNT74670.1 Sporulation related domain-containing protein [Paracoccus seriniphilus]